MRVTICHTSGVKASSVQSVCALLNEADKQIIQVEQGALDAAAVDAVWQAHVTDATTDASWDLIYAVIRDLRVQLDIDDSTTHFVYLLTEKANANRWFSFHEPIGTGANVYIHTADWGGFMPGASDFIFPVAHLVASNVLHRLVYPLMNDWDAAAHDIPEGCLMDKCMNKREIRLKLKAVDVCPLCQPDYQRALDEKRLHPNVLLDGLAMLEKVRSRFLFSDRTGLQKQPSRLEVRKHDGLLFLTDFGQLVPLPPQHWALYVYFLENAAERGIQCHQINQDRLLELYQLVARAGDLGAMIATVQRMCEETSFNTKISEIRKHFREVVGEYLTETYYLWPKRSDSQRMIPLDRKLVVVLDRDTPS